MPTLTPTLRYLGLAEQPRPPARQSPRGGGHRGAGYQRAPRSTSVTRRGVADAETLLGRPGLPAAVTPVAHGRRRRSSAPPVMTWLGLVEPRVRVSGHPRIRERMVESFTRRRRRQQVVTGSIGIILVLVLAGWGLLRSPLLAVEAVSIVGVEGDQATGLRDVVPVTAGQNVLDIDLVAVHDKVVGLPWVQAATVRRRLPSTVEIRVATRRPVLAGQFAGDTFTIDADGVVTGTQDRPDGLPTIILTAAPVVGDILDEDAALALTRVASQMPPGMNRWITGYVAADDNEVDALLVIPTTSGPAELTVHLGRPVSVPVKAATIASLVEETIGRGMRPQAFDVRIPDRPVVLA